MKEKFAAIAPMILGIVLLASFPLLLVWGLQLMGLPVKVTFASWIGSTLVMLFFIIANRIARFVKSEENA